MTSSFSQLEKFHVTITSTANFIRFELFGINLLTLLRDYLKDKFRHNVADSNDLFILLMLVLRPLLDTT